MSKDIKVGETYNVRVKVEHIDEDGWIKVRTSEKAISFLLAPKELEAFSPLPKYSPNRLFRKGDIVEVDTHGRDIADSMKKAGLVLGKRYTVTEDESTTGHDIGNVSFIGDDGIEHLSMFFWLKLVTPVEEQEPYSVSEATVQYLVKEDNKKVVAQFCKLYHPHAKAAAEAERDRLNAEYRKEQK